ncbi:hypothetical protein GQ600_24182 [Phytophthora cactorum]|nr:hypothetical protein GQ600_24182 [Phytophthora cactorum]
MNKIMEAIETIKIKDDIDLLAYWPDGYTKFDQLDGMASIIEARNHFILVMRTMRWIDDVEWRVSDLREPFSDTCNVTKNEQKGYVETLILGPNQVPGEFVAGHQLLDFLSLMVLRDEYPNVGIVSPSFHDFVKTEQRKRTAGGFGCANPQNKRVIGIFSVELHWVAFLVDRTIRTETNNGVCFMFDPLQLERNYATIEKCVWSTIEELLQLEDMLTYKKVGCCTQKDSSSCGVWSIAILEMLLSDASWDDCLYRLLPYLRMRFSYKAIAFIGKQGATDC